MTKAVTKERKSNALVNLSTFEIGNRSMAKDLADMIAATPEVMSEEDIANVEGLACDLFTAGKAAQGSFYQNSVLAEAIYDIQQKRQWRSLCKPDHPEERYESWRDFRVPLAAALGISTGSIVRYLKLVRYAREVLQTPPGEFAAQGGIVCVGAMLDECSAGCDGRDAQSWAVTVRPRTTSMSKELEKVCPNQPYDAQMRAYYDANVRHDYNDPTAINKPAAELRQQARGDAGAPSFSATHLMMGPRVIGYTVRMQYPDREEDGVTVVGECGTFELKFGHGFVPGPVLTWLDKRLNVK